MSIIILQGRQVILCNNMREREKEIFYFEVTYSLRRDFLGCGLYYTRMRVNIMYYTYNDVRVMCVLLE